MTVWGHWTAEGAELQSLREGNYEMKPLIPTACCWGHVPDGGIWNWNLNEHRCFDEFRRFGFAAAEALQICRFYLERGELLSEAEGKTP